MEEFRATEIFLNDDLGEYGNPEWRVNLTNIFDVGDWSFLLQSRYISEMIYDVQEDTTEATSGFYSCVQAGDTPCLLDETMEDYWVHDVSAAWRSDTWVVRLGVRNVLDEAPPITDDNALSVLGGIGYDLLGRTVFLNVTVGL
mgnify:FL=1